MALIKKPSQESTYVQHKDISASEDDYDIELRRKKAKTLAKQQQAAERISTATIELNSGISEAAAAANQLKISSQQIASGAEEASSAAQESLRAISSIADNLKKQLNLAELARNRTESMDTLTGKVQDTVKATVINVKHAAERQEESVIKVNKLEELARNIGDIVKAVARIADQTNLLALNAAIEAARAGRHGKGFAVVADEVRTLAETSEKSARDIQELIKKIQEDVKIISEGIKKSAEYVQNDAKKGQEANEKMLEVKNALNEILSGAIEIASAAKQSESAIQQAMRAAEQTAAAAEQQSSACEESNKTIEQQSTALRQAERASQLLMDTAEELKTSTNITKSSEDVASAAEELSSTVQEITSASSQIMVAVEEIRRGSASQSQATRESAASLTQIERGISISDQKINVSLTRSVAIKELIKENNSLIEQLVKGINYGVDQTKTSIEQIKELGVVSRKIDKTVDAITSVSIQTNMLAVNGSIEAARAGDFGKGFAVVATDIRNLARDSAENAERIKDMVKTVQDQISVVGRDLQEIITESISEANKSKEIVSNLKTMLQEVDLVEEGNKECSEFSQQIVKTLSEIKIAVEQIATAAAQSEKAAEQAASAAKEQNQSAEQLSAAVEEIASLADELQSN